MPTREEMHHLAQGIIASFEARTAGITSLREEVKEQRQATQNQLGELDRTHRAMARLQRSELARGRAALTALEARREAEVHTWLNEVDQAHQAMASQLRADLARGRAALTAPEARRKAEVNTWLKEVDRAHQAMASQLRADLARGRAALTAPEARRKAEVNTWLKEVDRAHQAMARRQRADLQRGRAALSGVEARRKATVHAWIGGVAAEHAGARQEWQRLAGTMAGIRSGAPAPVRPARVRTVAEEEEAVARAVVGPVTEELTSLGDRVFQYLANHPDGTRLAEIEREFELARLQAARVVRHLMDEGKAEKRGLSYFAT